MSLTFDPAEALAVLRRKDKVLAKVIRNAGPFTLKPERMVSPFHALLEAIVHQQLSGKAAKTIYGRVAALLPQPKRPTPEALLRLKEKQLRGAGLSNNKYLAIRDLSEKTLDGTVPTLAKLRKMSDSEIVERLTEVRGIGVWTVEMLLMFRLGRPDVLPVADLGVRHGFKLTYGLPEMPHVDHLTEHAERWRPFRSVASWYMWRAVDLHKAKTVKPVATKKP
jgi:3-methyladenine DNA glycosylase/8-oxoguanine DNA glycosylase